MASATPARTVVGHGAPDRVPADPGARNECGTDPRMNQEVALTEPGASGLRIASSGNGSLLGFSGRYQPGLEDKGRGRWRPTGDDSLEQVCKPTGHSEAKGADVGYDRG